jgi:hypothetical protein
MWERLIRQLRAGDCTPFLGAGACSGTLPGARELSREWADRYDYPFRDFEDLSRVMQFIAVSLRDHVYLKQLFCESLRSRGIPDFAEPTEPHAMLAGLPLPVFLTTNYDDFLWRALLAAGKQPRAAICPWYDSKLSIEEYDPTPDRPLIYHLHGSLQAEESLVLTPDHYVEFVVNVAKDWDNDNRRLLPRPILAALTQRPLLFVGYSLHDWNFRVLFHGLLKDIPDIRRRRHVSVQLHPDVDGRDPDAQERAREYLTRSLENWQISIFWGTAEEFCAELRSRLGGPA